MHVVPMPAQGILVLPPPLCLRTLRGVESVANSVIADVLIVSERIFLPRILGAGSASSNGFFGADGTCSF